MQFLKCVKPHSLSISKRRLNTVLLKLHYYDRAYDTGGQSNRRLLVRQLSLFPLSSHKKRDILPTPTGKNTPTKSTKNGSSPLLVRGSYFVVKRY
jgi:hypothetical protein